MLAVQQLPWIHRDPFDRLLLAQAAEERLTLAADRTLLGYGEGVRWAGGCLAVLLCFQPSFCSPCTRRM